MDIEKLIERLKEPDCDECTYEEKRECAGSAKCVLSGYAAEALSTLQAENEKLRAEVERVKRERDAAVKAVERVRSCKDCGHYTGEWTPPCKECQDSEEHHPYFKWRGQKKD